MPLRAVSEERTLEKDQLSSHSAASVVIVDIITSCQRSHALK